MAFKFGANSFNFNRSRFGYANFMLFAPQMSIIFFIIKPHPMDIIFPLFLFN